MIFDSLLIIMLLVTIPIVAWSIFKRLKAKILIKKDAGVAILACAEPEAFTVTEPVTLYKALARSRSQFLAGLKKLLGNGFDDKTRNDLEEILLLADVGVDTSDWVLEMLEERAGEDSVTDPVGLRVLLKQILASTLNVKVEEVKLGQPHVVLMVGVNGVGKTTTIGKLASRYKASGASVLLAAGDTFRAAAVEQLKIWGERNQALVVAQESGADSASVIYDACESAKARGIDVVLADTAGRLHNKANLMTELEKIGRVLGKLEIGAPHEVLLVLDAGTGQNAISQAREFAKAIKLTGLVLTKLDGSAKGGVVFALSREFSIPIRYVGLGENTQDLCEFDGEAFVDALFFEASE